jgi:hypothetical protein
VSKSTVQYQQKLQQLQEFVYGTLDLELTLVADNLNYICTWVDVSYILHSIMKSYTGGVISMGADGSLCRSTQQNLNTKRSTEVEIVGATNYLTSSIWSKMFMQSKGHIITTNAFEQDNVSTIRLENNGCNSAGNPSRHIDMHYFL